MQLYLGFKDAVDEDGTEDQTKRLVDIMLETVADKPSLIMPKYEQTETSETFSFWDLFKVNWARKLGLVEQKVTSTSVGSAEG